MAPRTTNALPPATSEHVCQAAETGRWSLVSSAVLERTPDNSIIAVPKDESRLISTALQQQAWDFLQGYVSLGYCKSLLTFQVIILPLVRDHGQFQFAIETILEFQCHYAYSSTWLLNVLDMCLRDGRHLSSAAQLVPLLPLDTPADHLTDRANWLEQLPQMDDAQAMMATALNARAETIRNPD